MSAGMKILIWNCQGAGKGCVFRALQEACVEHSPVAICLLETKSKRRRITRLCRRLGFYHWHVVESMRTIAGGMVLMWIAGVNVVTLFSNEGTIDVEVSNIARFTFVYGLREDCARFEEFDRIALSKKSDNLPWVLVGDFNEMLCSSEKDGGREFDFNRARRFREFVNNCEVLDVKACGSFFTWRNGHDPNSFIQERLDRVLINTAALGKYPNIEVSIPPCTASDHNMMILNLEAKFSMGKRLFIYEVRWQEEADYGEIVEQGWNVTSSLHRKGNVVKRLGSCRRKLKIWSKQLRGNPRKVLKDLRGKLALAEANGALSWEEQKLIRNEIDEYRRKEELYWGQRSRVKWLKFGDKNTIFFHRTVQQRRLYNRITKLKDDNGEWQGDPKLITGLLQQYYTDIYASGACQGVEEVLRMIEPCISEGEAMNSQLSKGLESNKIEVAYQEAVPLTRQEELIHEEEAAWQVESELKARCGSLGKEKKTKKKQVIFFPTPNIWYLCSKLCISRLDDLTKQKCNNQKGKHKAMEERPDVVVQDKHQGNAGQEGKDSILKVLEPDGLEDVSDLSDSVDGVGEVLHSNLEDPDASPITWDTKTSEVHPLTKATSSGISGFSCMQNGISDKRCPSAMDDSSSTCSTDSVPSVVTNGHYRGNTFPCLKNHRSTSR